MHPDQEHIPHSSGDNVGRDKIEYHFHGKKVWINRYLTGLPELQDELIGREQELLDLESKLHNAKSVVLMNGMGGIGKTTLALAYANLHRERYTHIAWVEVSGEFATALTSHFVLLQNLHIEKLTGSPQGDVLLILNELANLGGTNLLILDDANEHIKAYKAYLPKDWHVLITSREDLGFRHTLTLDFLSEDSARALFYTHYKWEQDDATVNAILQGVGNHTLTVELLAKTAQRRRIKRVAELREALEERGLEIGRVADFATLHSRDQKIERIFPYLKAVFKIDEDTLSETERLWLRRLAMLPPSFTKVEDIATCFKIEKDDTEAWDAYTATLESLYTKGWLIYDDKDDAYKMHQIIQEVARHYMPIVVVELNTLLEIMTDLVYVDTSTKDIVERFVWIPYAEHLLSLVADEKQEEVMELQHWLAWLYKYQGNYQRAKELLESVVRNGEAILEPNHTDIGRNYSTLGIISTDLGEYESAANYLEKALQNALIAHDETHFNITIRQSNLAIVYKHLGEFERARDLLEKVLENALKSFNEFHPNVAMSQSNLASVYKHLGEFERAQDLLEKALVSDIKNFGESHLNVAIDYNNLIGVYAHFEEWDKAQEACDKNLAICMKIFGAAHPHTKTAEYWRDWLREEMEKNRNM